MNVVWIFRDLRSGSSAFSEAISKHLQRPHEFIPDVELEKFRTTGLTKQPFNKADSVLYSTHTFEFLEYMNYYNDPLLVRCTRKNKAEQCLSLLFMRHMNYRMPTDKWFFNLSPSDDKSSRFFDHRDPIYLSKKEVFDYMRYSNRTDRLWDSVSAGHRSLAVYYEDLCTGIDIPELGLTNCKLSEDSATIKLPKYKSNLILNEKHVREWVAEYQALSHP